MSQLFRFFDSAGIFMSPFANLRALKYVTSFDTENSFSAFKETSFFLRFWGFFSAPILIKKFLEADTLFLLKKLCKKLIYYKKVSIILKPWGQVDQVKVI